MTDDDVYDADSYMNILRSSMTTASSSVISPTVTFTYQSPANNEVSLKLTSNTKKEIGANLYIKYVKSKLKKTQIEKVKRRLAKLQKLVPYSQEMGQKAMYENLCMEVAILVREAEMVAQGIDTWVDIEHINKFKDSVKNKVIKWNPLEKFPRVIPKRVRDKVKQLKAANTFDEYWILYIDYTGEELKTNKEKIRQKDPIIFGRLSHQLDRYYYIADWVDEYCDLTLTKMLDSIKVEDPEFSLSEVPDITKERWDSIVAEVKSRADRLDKTKPSNYKELMKEEDNINQKVFDKIKEEAKKEPVKTDPPPPKKPFWKFWS